MLTCVHVCTHAVEAHSLVNVHIRIFLFCMVNIALLSSPSSPFLILLSPSPSLPLPPIPPHPPVFFPLSSPSLPFSCVEDPEWEWGIVCETMAAPETIRDTFLTESAVKSSFMCLFGAVLPHPTKHALPHSSPHTPHSPILTPPHLPHPTQHTSISHPHTPFILPTPPTCTLPFLHLTHLTP